MQVVSNTKLNTVPKFDKFITAHFIQVERNNIWSRPLSSLQFNIPLMRGEYDDQLKWPFEGDVVELCNWKEDKGHHQDTFSFAKMDGYYRESMAAAWMNVNWDVISSSPTPPCYTTPPPTHSTFRMTKSKPIAVYHTPHVSKIPSWYDPLTPSQSLYKFIL